MKLDFTILRSRVGQRLFLLFVLCALLPIGILSLVSFHSVSRELQEQSANRLERLAKTQVMSVVERLELLGLELQVAAEQVTAASSGDPTRLIDLEEDGVRDRFLGLTLLPSPGETQHAAGGSAANADPIFDEPGLLDPAHTPLALRFTREAPMRGFLGLAVGDPESPQSTLWAEINPLFVWWGPQLENNLPPASELCVLNAARTAVLFCTTSSEVLQSLLAESPDALGELTWSQEDAEFLTSYRTANLRVQFDIDGLTVAVSQEKSYLLSPLADFRRSFPPIIVASLGLVLLLSIGQIRRRLVPLERLQSGTKRIAARDFSARVEVDSGDEFEQLAGDFNSMAERLAKQFDALRSTNEIVQAVLAALDREEIVRLVLADFDHLVPCEALSVALLQEHSSTSARVYLRSAESDDGVVTELVELADHELQSLHDNPRMLRLDSTSGLAALLRHQDHTTIGSVVVLPICVEDRVAGLIAASFPPGVTSEQEDLERARQLADQVAVAFSNAELLSQLEELSWGALTALARSIDAKSHWTAGHSERVARMAVALGREMGLSDEDLDILHRGSLLHDLGKIGVTSTILDKPGRLTDAEMEIVRGHVRIGARILEPIIQLRDLLPLVLQHHEWFNGKGYPEGRAGEQISFLARILAVVDIYDALRSPRPYRDPVDHPLVIQMITEGAGTQFDPQVVGAFLKCEAWQARDAPAAA